MSSPDSPATQVDRVPVLPGRWISPLRGRFVVAAILKIVAALFGYFALVLAVLLGMAMLTDAEPAGSAVALVVLVGTSAVALLGLWLFVVVPLGGRWDVLGWRPPERSMAHLLWQIPGLMMLGATVQLLMLLPYEVLTGSEPSTEQGLDDVLVGVPWFVVVVALLCITVVVPIWEELFFRGLVFGGLRPSLRLIPAALLAGLAFAAVHGLLAALPYLFVLGIGLCLMAEWYRSTIPCMILHGVNNAIVAVTLLSAIH